MDEGKKPIERRAPEPSPEDLSPDLQERDLKEYSPEVDQWAVEAVTELLNQFTELQKRSGLTDEEVIAGVNKAFSRMLEAQEKLTAFYDSEEIKVWNRIFTNTAEWFGINDPAYTMALIDTFTPLLPYLEEEMAAYKKRSGVSEVSLPDFLDKVENEPSGPFAQILIKAQERAEDKDAELGSESQENKTMEDTLRLLSDPSPARAIFPQKHDVPNNKFANKLAELVNAGEYDLLVSNKPKVYSSVEVTALDADGVKLSRNLTEYERQVMEAFVTVYKYGHPSHICSPNIIYRALTHNPAANPSDKDRDDILAAVEILTGIKGKINVTQEAEAFKYDVKEPYISGYILDLMEGGGIANGKRFVKWYIKAEPLVSQYANLAGNQRLTIPGEAYNVTYLEGNAPKPEDSWKPIHNSKDRIAIKGYMLRRIYQMRYDESRAKEDLRKYEYKRAQDKKKGIEFEERPLAFFRKEGRRISYSTVFEVTGLANKSNHTIAGHKQYMKCCLDYWKSCGYISNYHLVTGRSKGSVEAVDIFIQ